MMVDELQKREKRVHYVQDWILSMGDIEKCGQFGTECFLVIRTRGPNTITTTR